MEAIAIMYYLKNGINSNHISWHKSKSLQHQIPLMPNIIPKRLKIQNVQNTKCSKLRLQSNRTSVNHVQIGFDEDAQQYFDGVHFPLSLGIWSSTMGTNIKEKQYLPWTHGGAAAQKGPCLGEDKMGAGSYADVVVGCAERCVGNERMKMLYVSLISSVIYTI